MAGAGGPEGGGTGGVAAADWAAAEAHEAPAVGREVAEAAGAVPERVGPPLHEPGTTCTFPEREEGAPPGPAAEMGSPSSPMACSGTPDRAVSTPTPQRRRANGTPYLSSATGEPRVFRARVARPTEGNASTAFRSSSACTVGSWPAPHPCTSMIHRPTVLPLSGPPAGSRLKLYRCSSSPTSAGSISRTCGSAGCDRPVAEVGPPAAGP